MKLKQVDSIPNFFRDEQSGVYYVKKMVNGRVIWRSTRLTAEKAAFKRYKEISLELENRKVGWDTPDVPSLSEWWADYRAAKKKSPKTWKREEEIMEQHWLPQFGRLGLDEITQNQIERQLNWRRKKGAAEGTVTREQSLLHAVFEAAIDDDLIAKNPLRKIVRIPYATRKRVVTVEEQRRMLGALSPMLGRWFQFMLGTGIRLDECRTLRQTSVDFATSSISVIGKGHNGEPKVRDVPLLSPVLVEILREQIEENEGDTTYHRMNRSGTLWSQGPSFFRKELTKACKEANIKQFSPHTLRHSFATRYLQSGGDIFVLSKILGHYSVEITQKVYAHLLSNDTARLSQHVDLKLLTHEEMRATRRESETG